MEIPLKGEKNKTVDGEVRISELNGKQGDREGHAPGRPRQSLK
jgi:hypothetical protein